MGWSMKPLFLGSHPAMDFLNTRLTPHGTSIELIGDGMSFAAWLEEHSLRRAEGAVAGRS
jgi:Putative stress-induced transcription regulator